MSEAGAIDLDERPDLNALADDIARSTEPINLFLAGEKVAVIVPTLTVRQRLQRRPTPEQVRRRLALAGSWKDLFTGEEAKAWKRRISEERSSDRPPVEL